MSAPALPQPQRIRLTEDFIDLKVGMAYRKGTVLVRLNSGGQYGLEGTRLGQECVYSLTPLLGIYEVIEP